MHYNWQQEGWTKFTYDLREIEDQLFAFAEETGLMTGLLAALPEQEQAEAIVQMMVAEAVKTSEIEGEYLNRQDVVSSIRNKLGLNAQAEAVRDAKSQGAGELMVAVRDSYAEPLTQDMLFDWHRLLLGQSPQITVGAWRTHAEPMQVISGAMGKENVHFEAPPSARVPEEMQRFIDWFNDTAPDGAQPIKKAPVRSAIAHLYFESIHPFEDGNGRIGRAIAEKALAQTLNRTVLLSLSQTIEAEKKAYYTALETAQRSNEITPWLTYFVGVILKSQRQAKDLVQWTLKKAMFFDRYAHQWNERQRKAILRMLEEGPGGFKGGMTAAKYQSLTKAPKATATRDLQKLAEIGTLISQGGGRSTHYILNL
jgi:Fic family protein